MTKSRPSIISGPSEPALVNWTFNDVLRQRCTDHPTRPVLHSQHQNVTLTYEKLDRQARYLAAGLHEIGVGRGDRVGVLLGNRAEYAVIMLACSKLGAYFTLFNYAYTSAELFNALQATTPKVLFTTCATSRFAYEHLFEEMRRAIPQLETIVLLRDASTTAANVPGDASRALISYDDLLRRGSASSVNMDMLEKDVLESDILNLQFTSGSTGLPKVAALTHHGMANSSRYIGQKMNVKETDAINIPVPLFHAFGLVIGLCTAMLYGASVVLPSEYFEVDSTLRAVQRYKCTGLFGVTTMFVDMLSHPSFSTTDLSSLRFALLAGSAMPQGLLTRIGTRFGIRDIYTNWGMTELSSIATMTVASDPMDKKLRSAGRLLPNLTGKIVDPATARTLPWGQRGEIVVSGFGVMHSYYGQPERTDQAIRYHGERDAKDNKIRWMHTGDEGYLDPEGYFVITGRIKDLIIRGGENISPIEIESRLYQHSAVKQCAVFAVPSARYGEEVAAMLELSEGESRPSKADIRAWVREELARYKAPSYIWWLGDERAGVPTEWPKTANGKLRKDDVKEIAKELIKRYDTTEAISPSL